MVVPSYGTLFHLIGRRPSNRLDQARAFVFLALLSAPEPNASATKAFCSRLCRANVPAAVSALADMGPKTTFHRVIAEAGGKVKHGKAQRIVMCSGKIYYDLAKP